MSIASEITRLQQAKADIKTAIENKGVTVPSSAKLDTYDDYIDDIEQGGGTSLEDMPVIYIDYDGTVLYGYTAEQFAQLTEHPANPDHSGDDIPLTSQGWNWTLSDAKTYVAANGYLVIGQMYITTDGKTYIGIDTTKTTSDKFTYDGFYLSFSQSDANVTIDWGDGTTETTSGTGNKSVLHVYPSDGQYVIKLYATSGTLTLDNNFMGRYESNDRTIVTDAITFVRIGIVGTTINRCGGANLESITLPNNITKLGNGTFFMSHYLCGIVLPSSLTDLGTSCFQYCEKLKFVSFPKEISNIYDNCFGYCSGLEIVTLPNTITMIRQSAFSSCYNLKTAVLPNTLTTDQGTAFSSCYNLKTVINIPVTDDLINISGSQVESITIPSGIKSLSVALSGCRWLKELSIPNTLTTIPANAVRYCNSLKSVTIPQNVTAIGDNAFQACSQLETLNILGNVTSIGSNAFYGCYTLKNLVLPSSLITLGGACFSACYSLKTITIPNKVTTIGNTAFAYCTSAETITIGEKVSSIGTNVFSAQFRDRDRLKAIYVLAETPPTITSTSFTQLGSAFTIYVPAGKLSTYQSASNWTAFASRMVEMSSS